MLLTTRLRTGYSFRTAAGILPDVFARLAEIGAQTVPITDRASTFGWTKFDKAARKAGMRPVFGVELGVSANPEAKKPGLDHWTFLAVDTIEPINRLVATATAQFRYEPLLSYQQAMQMRGVVRVIGSRSDFEHVTPWLNHDVDDTYLACSPSAAPGYLRAAIDLGLPLCAAIDNFYPTEGDEGLYGVIAGRGASTQTWPQHIMSRDEWRQSMSFKGLKPHELDAAEINAGIILERCRAELMQGVMLEPHKPKPLRQLCEEGAALIGCDLTRPEYAARLERELTLIEEKRFADYFHIVAEVVQWSRARMCMGPARGSSAGSLVCYLLRITTVDPIRYGLIFERFIDVTRDNLPDIDIDFSDAKRDMAFRYMAETYGRDRVARLGSVGRYQADGAAKETAGALGIGAWLVKPVQEALVKYSQGDERRGAAFGEALTSSEPGRKLLETYPEMMVAARVESHPRYPGQHAAGMVLTRDPIVRYVAVDSRTGSTHCDKKDAEELNLLKIDALGLIQLSVFENALASAGLPHDHLDRVPLDDAGAFEVMNSKRYAGIFQFDAPTMKDVAQRCTFDHLDVFSALVALGRPGPLGSGGTALWIRRKMGQEPVSYPHKVFEPILRETYGVPIYQEQIMQICREIGRMDWGEVNAVRKAMSAMKGREHFDQFRDKFRTNAIAQGVPPDVADKTWNDLLAFGNNSFNKSHAVSYGLVSYYCCWLKANYPMEFAAATLQRQGSAESQIAFLRELDAEGISYIPVDAAFSTDAWSAQSVNGRRMLVGPLHMVKGLGPALASQIMSARARGEPLSGRAQKLLHEPKTEIDSLWPIRDAFRAQLPDPAARGIVSVPETVRQVLDGPMDRPVVMFVTLVQPKVQDENDAIRVERRKGALLRDGLVKSLNIQLRDDTGTIFGKINRFKFEKIAQTVLDHGKWGKCLYAVKGSVWQMKDDGFTGVSIDHIRHIGDTK